VKNNHYIYNQTIELKDMQDVNRLKLVLVEKKKTSKWLAEKLDVNPSTVSKWCTNSSQPDLETLIRIAGFLQVKVEHLLNTLENY
jgi:transcriptional regulator with XRE-family HTH domain